MKDFNKLIQDRADNSFDSIIRVTAAMAFVGAVLLYFSDFLVYAVLNFATCIVLLLITIFSKRIQTFYKVLVMIVVTAVISIASYIGGSFTSAFLTLLIISNIIAVFFLNRTQSIIISVLSVCTLIGLGIYSILTDQSSSVFLHIMTWGLQIAAFLVLVAVLHNTFNTMKSYLIENIMGLETAVKQANQLAYYDQLTQLPNAYRLKMEMLRMINERTQDGYLVFLNLGSLSLINSTLGHEFGDHVLVSSAKVLDRYSDENTIVARTGGNEFALWVQGVSEWTLEQKLAEIMSELKVHNLVLRKKLEIYGAYTKFDHGIDDLEGCYRQATLALTYAKEHHSIAIVPYNNQLEMEIRRKEKLKDMIGEALREHEFILHYQAKVDARTERVIGFEGLARWYSDEMGTISPGEFIPIVESLNMANEFGEYIVRQALNDYVLLNEKYGNDFGLSINISPSHIMDPRIVGMLEEELAKYEIPRESITLEITEDVMIDGIEDVKPVLGALKALGLKLSLDDFGTGYSSLNYLSQLELDELKIDKSFIERIGMEKNSHILLENIIHLSKQFGLNLVAEGVENQEQCNELLKMGCHVIQGYHFAKPKPLKNLLS